ncbi:MULTISPECIES: hypothetical protein [Sphingomonas]|uniref:Sel1 repeat family protein n=1 Tax=Sphingomonas kyeonggiensis TaxID=1268553 RepID=A0A7W7JZ53_9SPHN|nr:MULTISPECIES: hypothetical protein [Sphingomonas]MBB4837687.1 hypothetical protein [Sphingomonas kyeonggiensis]WHU01794.1 hypothetical protein O3305_16570 [Sphingomonas sp. NIBR02145]
MTREDRLFERARAIMQRRANGHYRPILRHLARRGHAHAMLELAGLFSQGNDPADLGVMSRAGTPAWLYRRVWMRGGPYACLAAQNLAMSRFNIGDLHGYRLWLRRAQMLGDNDSGLELDRFETRLPFGDARAIGRGRPWRRNER